MYTKCFCGNVYYRMNWHLESYYLFISLSIYKTIILPIVLYGCEKWSLVLRDERRLRVFYNRILRRIFGPTRDANWK